MHYHKTTPAQDTKPKKKNNKNNNHTTNNYNPYIQYQHTLRSLQYKIPYPQYTSSIQIHSLQPTFMCPRSITGVPFDSVRRFRATLLLHTACVRSSCTWRASCVAAFKKKKGIGPQNKWLGNWTDLNWTIVFHMCVRMPLSSRSIAEVPSSRALPDYPITEHNMCAFCNGLAVSVAA